MNSAGELLRRAREEQGRSLDDIAAATRIHRKFLEQVEQGTLSSLPITYVRAFIRGYAAEVHLDPAEVLKQFESTGTTVAGVQPPSQTPSPAETGGTAASQGAPQSAQPELLKNKQGKVLLIFSVLLLLGLAASLYWMRQRHSAEPVREIVFQDMVKEWEAKNAPVPPKPAVDTAAGGAPSDSLSLVGVAIDTVWVRFAVDVATPHEVILKPKQQMRLKARDKFTLSLGNAGGIAFTLNGNSLGTLGQRGKPLGNISINRKTLERFRNPPSKQ